MRMVDLVDFVTAIFFQVATNMHQERDVTNRSNHQQDQGTSTNGNSEER